MAARGARATGADAGDRVFSARTQHSDEPLRLIPFREGLKEAGYIDGRNLVSEYRWAEDQYDRLPELADDLLRRHVR